LLGLRSRKLLLKGLRGMIQHGHWRSRELLAGVLLWSEVRAELLHSTRSWWLQTLRQEGSELPRKRSSLLQLLHLLRSEDDLLSNWQQEGPIWKLLNPTELHW
jgi:hypothetical protein